MKIRTKLTLIFTTLTAFLILVLGLSIYYSSLGFARRDFFDQLRKRTDITAQVYLRKDETDARLYQQMRATFIRSLPGEDEQIYNLRRRPLIGGALRRQPLFTLTWSLPRRPVHFWPFHF